MCHPCKLARAIYCIYLFSSLLRMHYSTLFEVGVTITWSPSRGHHHSRWELRFGRMSPSPSSCGLIGITRDRFSRAVDLVSLLMADSLEKLWFPKHGCTTLFDEHVLMSLVWYAIVQAGHGQTGRGRSTVRQDFYDFNNRQLWVSQNMLSSLTWSMKTKTVSFLSSWLVTFASFVACCVSHVVLRQIRLVSETWSCGP